MSEVKFIAPMYRNYACQANNITASVLFACKANNITISELFVRKVNSIATVNVTLRVDFHAILCNNRMSANTNIYMCI